MPVSLLSLLTTIALLFNEVGASDAAFDLVAVITSAVDTVKADIFAVLAVIIPASALILAAVTAWNFGRKWIKKLAN